MEGEKSMTDEKFIQANLKKALESESLSAEDRLKLIARLERPTVDALQGIMDKINAALAVFESRVKKLEAVGLARLAPAQRTPPNLEGINRLG